MLSIEARKALGEVAETEYVHGGYRMAITWHRDNDYAQVAMYDLGQWKTLLWSKGMTKQQARGAKDLFGLFGYFDMPV